MSDRSRKTFLSHPVKSADSGPLSEIPDASPMRIENTPQGVYKGPSYVDNEDASTSLRKDAAKGVPVMSIVLEKT